ncbi:glycosyltransferase family 4 protein [Pontibacter qinzhouensis]|uniref:Glycosyltransferase family 4 protein n=1 Tax=Pontibacter qinzhouensis TaxID=2603253 RepID=A0A5C8JGS6_9BACT|nr:glycosyltransferase family 4 protein [Pontibacter qinzhouensis]TXK36808.1 glycosyltransferase family 4 protein [Pontibacter qinzhouensis]
MRIALVINTSWNIYNFRLRLIEALLAQGHEVVAVAPYDNYSQKLELAGCQFVPVPISQSTNPVTDLKLLWRLYRTYRRLKPDVLLHYTIKPNIYGTIAAKLAGIPAINNVSGLGTVFIVKDFVAAVAQALYRFAFRFPGKVFFQNADDQKLFLEKELVRQEITEVLPGSGIDLEAFVPAATYQRNQPFVFLMVARLMFEKGIAEYVEAARLVKARFPEVRCQVLGAIADSNRSGISPELLAEWRQAGDIEYLGFTDDVAPIVAQADCVVLPSYREGTPRTLLEAAAMAKPLIATDVPGCREVVKDNENGLLCQVRSATDLAAKMLQLLQLSNEQLQQMGQASRKLAETKFNDRFVIDRYLAAIAEVTKTAANRNPNV